MRSIKANNHLVDKKTIKKVEFGFIEKKGGLML